MSHTGGRSTGWQRAAARKRWRFVSAGASDFVWSTETAVILCKEYAEIQKTASRFSCATLFGRRFLIKGRQ
jgi:hypothetical protein